MKKILAFALAVCLLVSVGAVIASAATSGVSSSSSTISAGESRTASVTYGGQKISYSFTPRYTGSYTFYSEGSNDTVGYIYLGSRELGANDDYSGRNFSITLTLTAGNTYTLKTGLYSSSNTGSFTVYLTANFDIPEEESSVVEDYVTVYAGSSYSVYIYESGDYFWGSFVPEYSGNYVFRSSGSVDAVGYIFDRYEDQIAYNDDGAGGGNFYMSCYLTAGERYYLKAKAYGSGTGNFSIMISREDAVETTAADEHIDPPTYGDQIYTGEDYRIYMDASNYYTALFVPTMSGTYTFQSVSDSGLDPYGYILDAAGNALATNDDSSGYDFAVSHYLVAGETYYLRVRPVGSEGWIYVSIYLSSLEDYTGGYESSTGRPEYGTGSGSTHTHSFGSWNTQTTPTCTEEGYATRTCTTCGYTASKTLETLEHEYEATGVRDGKTIYTCAICEQRKPEETTRAPETVISFETAAEEKADSVGSIIGSIFGGCGSVVSSASLLVVATLAAAVVVRKKKD